MLSNVKEHDRIRGHFFIKRINERCGDMAKQYKLTPKRLQELQEELNYLKTVREKEVAEQIKEARSFGENSEYDEAKNEQGKLYSHIAEIEAILASYVLIEEKPISATAVSLGSQVTVEDQETKDKDTYRIVGSQEADPMNGRISEDSPFGKALLGKEAGEIAEVEAPMGVLRYKVLKIDKH